MMVKEKTATAVRAACDERLMRALGSHRMTSGTLVDALFVDLPTKWTWGVVQRLVAAWLLDHPELVTVDQDNRWSARCPVHVRPAWMTAIAQPPAAVKAAPAPLTAEQRKAERRESRHEHDTALIVSVIADPQAWSVRWIAARTHLHPTRVGYLVKRGGLILPMVPPPAPKEPRARRIPRERPPSPRQLRAEAELATIRAVLDEPHAWSTSWISEATGLPCTRVRFLRERYNLVLPPFPGLNKPGRPTKYTAEQDARHVQLIRDAVASPCAWSLAWIKRTTGIPSWRIMRLASRFNILLPCFARGASRGHKRITTTGQGAA